MAEDPAKSSRPNGIETALGDPGVPKLYTSGFSLGFSNADLNLLRETSGRPVALVNMSYSLATLRHYKIHWGRWLLSLNHELAVSCLRQMKSTPGGQMKLLMCAVALFPLGLAESQHRNVRLDSEAIAGLGQPTAALKSEAGPLGIATASRFSLRPIVFGAVIGAAVGAVVGYGVGGGGPRSCPTSPNFSCDQPAFGPIGGAALGLALGATVGVIVGSMQRDGSRVEVVPRVNPGGTGLRLRYSRQF